MCVCVIFVCVYCVCVCVKRDREETEKERERGEGKERERRRKGRKVSEKGGRVSLGRPSRQRWPCPPVGASTVVPDRGGGAGDSGEAVVCAHPAADCVIRDASGLCTTFPLSLPLSLRLSLSAVCGSSCGALWTDLPRRRKSRRPCAFRRSAAPAGRPSSAPS